MNREQILNLPVVALNALVDYKKMAQESLANHSDLVDGVLPDDYELRANSKDNRFYFQVTRLKWSESMALSGNLKQCPVSLNSIEPSSRIFPAKDISAFFNRWIELVKEYNKALQEVDDPYFVQFETELEADFDFVKNGENGDEALNHESQIQLFDVLSRLEEKFKSEDLSNHEVQKLLDYTTQLKNDIPRLSKTVLKKKAINLLLKARKLGLKFVKDVLDVGYKEGIKYALRSGGHHLGDVLQQLIN